MSPLKENHRFARRCHLTEQIGARRRELYANDTWLPAGTDIRWAYRSQPSDENHFARVKSPGIDRLPVVEERLEPIPHSESCGEAVVDQGNKSDQRFHERLSREFESVSAILSSTSSKDQRSEIESVWSSLTANIACLEGARNKVDCESFLENYLSLYRRMDLVDAAEKLSSVVLPGLPRSKIMCLRLFYDTLTCPPAVDLLSLRQAVETIDIKLVPTAQLLELAKLRAFLFHPLVHSLILSADSEKPPGAAKTVSIEWPTKAALKRIKLPLESVTRAVFVDDLKAKEVSIAFLYRLELLRAYVSDCEESQSIIEKISSNSSEILKQSIEAQMLAKINDNFRSQLFPVS